MRGVKSSEEIAPEVWSQKSPAGESYEFKVNCLGNYDQLEECFLWDLTGVRVTDPNGRTYELEKDFNVNEYSGEITRRWVLYGPAEGAKLPPAGIYLFEYIRDGGTVFTQQLDYSPSTIGYPTGVSWEKRDGDLYVSWTPPEGVDSSMWYKVLVWNEAGTPDLFISDTFDWDAREAVLKDVTLKKGGTYSLNVAVYYPDGYAYSKYAIFEW